MSEHIDDGSTATASAEELAAAKKRAKAKAKRARQKANKKAKKQSAAAQAAGAAPADRGFVNHTRRGPAGKGRGQGLFATVAIPKGEVVVRAQPVLSTVFDKYTTSVCAFCFRTATATRTGENLAATQNQQHQLLLRTGTSGRLGIFVDERKASGTAPAVAVLNGCAYGSANSEAGIQAGDVVASVAGVAVAPGDGVLQRCLTALSSAGAAAGASGFEVVVLRSSLSPPSSRVGLEPCTKCLRCTTCAGCRAAGRLDWHRGFECDAFQKLPAGARRGESSPIRMMLRYRAIDAVGDWARSCPADDVDEPNAGQEAAAVGEKEPLSLVSTLQANKDVVPGPQKAMLANLTGIPEQVVAQIVGQIRGNACSIQRGGGGSRLGEKVGCALSVFMGYSNHDCNPNTEACVDDEGYGADFRIARQL